jgi:hypothetical protein
MGDSYLFKVRIVSYYKQEKRGDFTRYEGDFFGRGLLFFNKYFLKKEYER